MRSYLNTGRARGPLATAGFFCAKMAIVVSIAALLSSCELAKNQLTTDRNIDLDRQAYRDALAPVAPKPEDAAPIPAFESVITTPEDLRLPSPLVTVSVNNTVSLRDLMFELAEQAGVDIELDPQIRGSVIFTAKERPFDEVVNRICEMAGLRYTFKNHVLRVELDRPYVKNYNIDYLNVARKATSSMKTTVDLGSSSSSTGNATTSGGSNATIDTDYSIDVWKDLTDNIEQILTSSDTYTSLATMADPIITPISTMPPALPVDPNDPSSVPPALPGSPQVSQMAPSVAPTLSITPGKAEPLVPNPPATYSLSKQTGMLSVFATERQQKAVAKFLDEYRRRSMTQVVIEAKVLQVDLNDEFATGIDWNNVNLTGILTANPTFPIPTLDPAAGNNTFTAIFKPGNDLNIAVSALSRFGTVRALSSPRVTVLNNQPALVNVAQNQIYFSFDVQTNDDSDTNQTRINVDSEQKSAPEGVILNVIPTANPDTGEIMLSVRPTVSRITSTVADPTIPLSLAALGLDPTAAGIPANNVPEISVQEIDSILKLQSGQLAVMGGLMRDTTDQTETGIPVMGDLPYIGALFRNHTDKIQKSELVIFIKAYIMPGSNIDDTDRKIYNTFGNDRHPANL